MRLALKLAALALAAAAHASTPTPSAAPVPAGAYQPDKAHTSLIFRVNHMGFSTFTGRFTRLDAELQFDPAKLAASHVTVNIDPRSIETDNAPAGFLATLSGNGWLEADKFPEMAFRSNSIEPTGKNTFLIHGELTLHGVTRPIVLDARYNGGYAGHPLDPHARVGFSAHGSLKRSDFGVSLGIPAPGSLFGVGDQVEITLETEFTGPPLVAGQR